MAIRSVPFSSVSLVLIRSTSILLAMMILLLAGASISRVEITCNTTYRVDPISAAPTDTTFNAALAATGKTYAVDPVTGLGIFGEVRQYQGERLSSLTLARGGSLLLNYSNDGAWILPTG